MSKLRIMLAEGHGGSDSGAVGHGLKEKDCNLAVAQAAKVHLEKLLSNIEVGFARGSDKSITPDQRLAAVRAFKPTILVEIHHNSSTNPTATGREVFYPQNDPRAKELAELIGEKTKAEGFVWRGAKTRLNSAGKDYYYMLREATSKDTISIFYEGAFISNASDAAYLKNGGCEKQGKIIAEAIAEYAIKHGLAKPATAKPAPKKPTLIEHAAIDFFNSVLADGWYLDGVAYIPLRTAAELLGFKVHYVSKTEPIKVRK